jgi:hypothetical protein
VLRYIQVTQGQLLTNRVYRESPSLMAALVVKIKLSVDQWGQAGLINRSELLGE